MLFPQIDKMLYWIRERESIRIKRELGEPKPWSNDPALRDYRYCNVQREHDAVTAWIRRNWREPFSTHPNIALAMIAARLFNQPSTLEALRFPVNKDFLPHWRDVLENLEAEGKKVFNAAYVVSTNGHAVRKIHYLLDGVLARFLKEGRLPRHGESLSSYASHLRLFEGLGSFMSGQVIADLKYTPALISAPDWWTWSNPGPGSKRGFNRVRDAYINSFISREMWETGIEELRQRVLDEVGLSLHAQDMQNVLCETDKYMRLLSGEGRPKQQYKGV